MEVFAPLLERFPGRFSVELGIELISGREARQQWLLAAILYGARISGLLAARTYKVLAARGVVTPAAILEQGWDNLVALLDEGGYARYDFKTATKLLQVMTSLQEHYQGDLERLHDSALDYQDLEKRLLSLAPGIGPVTINIFLRELRGVWTKATPPLSSWAQMAAEDLGIVAPGLPPLTAWQTLEAAWPEQPVAGFMVTDIEAALVRLGRDFCRKIKGPLECPMGSFCRRRLSPAPEAATPV